MRNRNITNSYLLTGDAADLVTLFQDQKAARRERRIASYAHERADRTRVLGQSREDVTERIARGMLSGRGQ